MPYVLETPHLTPEQRRHEIAAILARGVRRLSQIPPESAEFGLSGAPEWPQKGLEVSGTSRPHVARG